MIQSTNRIVPNSISKSSRKTRLTENVGKRRNSPGFEETQIRKERTAMHQFSLFSVSFYTDSLKFGAKAPIMRKSRTLESTLTMSKVHLLLMNFSRILCPYHPGHETMIRPGSITPPFVELQRQLSPASSRSPILICVQGSSYSWSSKTEMFIRYAKLFIKQKVSISGSL